MDGKIFIIILVFNNTINSKTYSANITNQMAIIEIYGLDAGTYTGNMTYDSDNFIKTVQNATFNVLKQRLREMAFLTKGLRISLTDKRVEEGEDPQVQTFH